MKDVDVAIVGAGVIGLACAATLAERGDSVALLEQHDRVGHETSSRNSGVVHAGIYYAPGSLKAQLCVQGRELLYARAKRDSIDHRRTGKLILACDAGEVAQLEALQARARENGAGAVRMLSAAELREQQPRVRAAAALWSPETGIVDSHALMGSYLSQARRRGAILSEQTRVIAIAPARSGYELVTLDARGGRHTLRAQRIVNAAGLHASTIASLSGLAVERLGYVQRFCKGSYFRLGSRFRKLTSCLLYPLPTAAGLGIHITLDLGGELRAGPDTEYVDTLDYTIDPNSKRHFVEALRRYLPEITEADLSPEYSGIRPKLDAADGGTSDFVIADASAHGQPGYIHLLGIESPGLTASEAIAKRVAQLLPK